MLSFERRNGGSGQRRTGREAEGQPSISLDVEPQPIAAGNPGDGCRLGASSRPSPVAARGRSVHEGKGRVYRFWIWEKKVYPQYVAGPPK